MHPEDMQNPDMIEDCHPEEMQNPDMIEECHPEEGRSPDMIEECHPEEGRSPDVRISKKKKVQNFIKKFCTFIFCVYICSPK